MTDTWDPEYIELIASIRRCRKVRGITQRDLAAKLGKKQTFISKIETCERRLDLVETLKVCEALDIGLCEVVPSNYIMVLKKES